MKLPSRLHTPRVGDLFLEKQPLHSANFFPSTCPVIFLKHLLSTLYALYPPDSVYASRCACAVKQPPQQDVCSSLLQECRRYIFFLPRFLDVRYMKTCKRNRISPIPS